MSNPYGSSELKLKKAAEFIRAGQKNEARQLLRDILVTDQNNLAAWELLAYATLNVKEETYCLNRILSLRPDHPWAGQRLAAMSTPAPSDQVSPQPDQPQPEPEIEAPKPVRVPASARSVPRERPRKRHREIAPILLGMTILCGILLMGLMIIRFGYLPSNASAQQTRTSIARNNLLCQEIIGRALELSGSSCDQIDSNNICYGNDTLLAELLPEASQRFSERGDIVGVNFLRRLSVSPINLDTQEWGIAIFKVLANLPRSLPGETVTLMVFGNTTLDNQSQNLETFYFSSGLGEIVCEEVPFDGIMLSMPDGAGIRFSVNGAELMLMGNAGLTAVQNGDMEVKLYSGSGQITSMGQTQSFGAGQQVSVGLGGSNGTEAVSVPSAPVPLSPEDLLLACTMAGQYCSEDEIQPVSAEDAQKTVQAGLLVTATAQPTSTPSLTPTITWTPTISFTSTTTFTKTITPNPSQSPTRTRTATKTLTPTRTFTATGTFTISNTPTISRTPSLTGTPTPTFTATLTSTASNTPTPSFTPSDTATPTLSPTITDTPTITFTPSPTRTPSNTPSGPVACVPAQIYFGSVVFDFDQLHANITNNFGASIRIIILHLDWQDAGSTELDYIQLDNNDIWDNSGGLVDASPPSDFAVSGSEFNWDSGNVARTINAGQTEMLEFDFDPNEDLPAGFYAVRVTFGGSANCYIDTSITK
jgi:hypothetical protein